MTKPAKILPCPVCGRVPVPGEWPGEIMWSLECHAETVNLYHTISAHGRTPRTAINRWNKLVGP